MYAPNSHINHYKHFANDVMKDKREELEAQIGSDAVQKLNDNKVLNALNDIEEATKEANEYDNHEDHVTNMITEDGEINIGRLVDELVKMRILLGMNSYD
jgi:hypothetical protein